MLQRRAMVQLCKHSPRRHARTGVKMRPMSAMAQASAPLNEMVWDNILSDIQPSPLSAKQYIRPARGRQSMTAREISAFDDMFTMIFDAVNKHQETQAHNDLHNLITPAPPIGVPDIADPLSQAAIGRTPDGNQQVWDLMGKLRSRSRRLRWTTEEEELLDRKKEQMELCDTDQQLLQWAITEVFDDSRRHEERARQAAEAPRSSSAPIKLQSPMYPHLLGLLMRTFRDKYGDPHLALSVFEHARHLSIASYVFGCTTPAYNELIDTRWRCFRDLRGVRDALHEMKVNGIECDTRTRALVEGLRREVGQRKLWMEEASSGEAEVWEMLKEIDTLSVIAPRPHERQKGKTEQSQTQKKQSRKWKASDEEWRRQQSDDLLDHLDLVDLGKEKGPSTEHDGSYLGSGSPAEEPVDWLELEQGLMV